MCIKCSSFLIFSSLFKNTIRGTSRAAKGYRELLLSPSHYGDTGQTWSHSNHLSPREIWSQNSGWFLLLMFVCFYLTRLPAIRFFFYLIFFSDLSVPQLTTTVNVSTSTRRLMLLQHPDVHQSLGLQLFVICFISLTHFLKLRLCQIFSSKWSF